MKKTASKAATESRDNLAVNGTERDASGRFLPGHAGLGGRPRALDLRRIAEERAQAEGLSLETMLWEILKAMVERAKDGDVAAAKIVLDRLAGPVQQRIEAEIHAGQSGPPVPEDAGDLLNFVDEMHRVAHEVLPDAVNR